MTKLVLGNAKEEGANRGGWFLGHFITPEDDTRSTEDLEVKWGVHKICTDFIQCRFRDSVEC